MMERMSNASFLECMQTIISEKGNSERHSISGCKSSVGHHCDSIRCVDVGAVDWY